MVFVTEGRGFRPAATYGRLGDFEESAKNVIRDVKDVLFKTSSTTPSPLPMTAPAPAQPTILGMPQGMVLLAGGLALGAGVLIFVLSRD